MRTQTHSLELLDSFLRDEQADCESFNEALKEVRRLATQRGEVKSKMDRQMEGVGIMMEMQARGMTHDGVAVEEGVLEKAKNDLEALERDFKFN